MKKKLLLVLMLTALCCLFACNALAWDCSVDGHVEKITLGKEKTCTVDGYNSLYCTKCRDILVEEYEVREATGHVWNEKPFKTTAATCDSTGEERYMCKKCTEVNVVVLPKDPNNHSDIQKDLEQQPTCTEEGWYNLRCHGCAKLVETNVEYVPAKGHPGFQAWKTTKLPTCTESGLRIRMCKACTYVEKEELGSLGGHKYGNWVTKMDASCLMEGKQERTCSVCGDVDSRDLAKLDHVWGEWKTDKAPGCETPGTRKHTCTLCNRAYETEDIDPIGHTAGSYKRVKEPTCEKTGLMQAKCVRCSYVMAEEDIPALGHDFTKEVNVKVSCYQDGYTGMACSHEGCEAVDESTKKITQAAPMIHYTQTRVLSEGNTCLEEDVIVTYCRHCGYEWEPTYSPSAKHTWGEWKVMNCQSVGTQERTCSTCGEVETEFIGYRPHTYDNGYFFTKEGEFLTHPDGTYVRACDVCGNADVYADWFPEYVGNTDFCAKYGHGYDLVTEPDPTLSCTQKQILTWKCAYCGELKSEEAAFTDHLFTDWSRYVINQVTRKSYCLDCVNDGTEMRYCKRCGLEETRFAGKKNHNFTVYSDAVEASCTADAENAKYICLDCCCIYKTNGIGTTIEIPEKAYGHSYVTIPAVPATATTPGLTAGVRCENCGHWKKAQFKVDVNNQLVSEVAVLLTMDEDTCKVYDSYGKEVGSWRAVWGYAGTDTALDNMDNPVKVDGNNVESGDLITSGGNVFSFTYNGKEYNGLISAADNSVLIGSVKGEDTGIHRIGRVDSVGNISLKLDGTNYTYVGTSVNFVPDHSNTPFYENFNKEKYLDDFYANIENGEELRARVNDDACITGTIAAVSLHGNFDESQAVVIGLNEDGMVCPECSYPMTQWFNWIADQMKCFCTNTNCGHVEYTEP